MGINANRARWACIAVLLLCVSLLSACSTFGQQPASELPLPDPLSEALERPDYQIVPGDLLQVRVYQMDDLEREVRVDNAGKITLPLIGSVDAAGLSVSELEQRVAAAYGERYLQNPQVSVLIKDPVGQRVTVTGAVEQPGIYPMGDTQLTLQQALALGRGVTNVASLRNVVIFRTVEGQRMLARFDLKRIQQGKDPDPHVYGGDIVVVYRSDARLLLRTLVELTPIILVWRAYR